MIGPSSYPGKIFQQCAANFIAVWIPYRCALISMEYPPPQTAAPIPTSLMMGLQWGGDGQLPSLPAALPADMRCRKRLWTNIVAGPLVWQYHCTNPNEVYTVSINFWKEQCICRKAWIIFNLYISQLVEEMSLCHKKDHVSWQLAAGFQSCLNLASSLPCRIPLHCIFARLQVLKKIPYSWEVLLLGWQLGSGMPNDTRCH